MILTHILKIDAIAIDALLLVTLQDSVKYRQLVRRRDQDAQALLNLLQAVSSLQPDICNSFPHIGQPETASGISTGSISQTFASGRAYKTIQFIRSVSRMHDLERG
jgi:hypothetical protein